MYSTRDPAASGGLIELLKVLAGRAAPVPAGRIISRLAGVFKAKRVFFYLFTLTFQLKFPCLLGP